MPTLKTDVTQAAVDAAAKKTGQASRTPELREGARAVRKDNVCTVTRQPWRESWPDRDTGEEVSADLIEIDGLSVRVEDLIVLPEEVEP